jgi:rare lipoprotein A (peptidoglycan hydrolase)
MVKEKVTEGLKKLMSYTLRNINAFALLLLSQCVSTGRSGKMQSLQKMSAQTCAQWKTGIASFYADSFEGKTTASGEIFSQSKPTAAHLKLPFGTRVLVRLQSTKRYIIVRINDRGPYGPQIQAKRPGKNISSKNNQNRNNSRILDLSKSAAQSIGLGSTQGLGKISYCVLPHNFAQETQ